VFLRTASYQLSIHGRWAVARDREVFTCALCFWFFFWAHFGTRNGARNGSHFGVHFGSQNGPQRRHCKWSLGRDHLGPWQVATSLQPLCCCSHSSHSTCPNQANSFNHNGSPLLAKRPHFQLRWANSFNHNYTYKILRAPCGRARGALVVCLTVAPT
jgi:hypothetical protein